MPKQTPREIHKQYDVFDNELKIAINQQYSKPIKSWKFVGYKCRHCNSSFKFVSSMAKHENTCKVLNKLKGKDNANTEDNDEG